MNCAPNPETPRGRRQAFEAVSGYRPPPGPRSPDVRVPAEQPAPATISHVRIAASEAALENENDRYRVRFFGGPPDGVQITLFDNQARPVLDVRTGPSHLFLPRTERCFPGDDHLRPAGALLHTRRPLLPPGPGPLEHDPVAARKKTVLSRCPSGCLKTSSLSPLPRPAFPFQAQRGHRRRTQTGQPA